jgi:hypothetical protein
MKNSTKCLHSWIKEVNVNGTIQVFRSPDVHGNEEPCVHILDLQSVHPLARGFRRGFLGYPYGYLSPGTDQIAVRLDLLNFSLNTTKFIDLAKINPSYGGYSGGFSDHLWACYT